jgi:hypothetical protein
MKDMGAPIDYSNIHKTYYYKRACDVNIECSFRCLSEDEEQDTFGGFDIFRQKYSLLLVLCSEWA